ncbi:hypothetical protein KY329_03040 [Candidatus Woesearchaeota archaeon]|nr:hypothetical protein [Candidatus Woesearchaeota archaeon]
MGASKILRLGLYGLFGLALCGCVPEGKDLPYTERWAFQRREKTAIERIEPEDPRDLCSYSDAGEFARYKFEALPAPILVDKTAENDLVVRLRKLQRDLGRKLNAIEMADVMNLWSASANTELEERIPDGIITHEDIGRPYSEHLHLAREYLD